MNPALTSYPWRLAVLVAVCPSCNELGLIRKGRCWMCGGWEGATYPDHRFTFFISDLLKPGIN